jgi:N-acetylglucosamine-6-phosphate deacetylase
MATITVSLVPLGILGGAGDVNQENETRILKQDQKGEDTNINRPYFGIIADGNHVHPASIRLAQLMHPGGLVLVTDALLLLGGEDGTIDWLTRRLTKKGVSVTLEGTDIIAGRYDIISLFHITRVEVLTSRCLAV